MQGDVKAAYRQVKGELEETLSVESWGRTPEEKAAVEQHLMDLGKLPAGLLAKLRRNGLSSVRIGTGPVSQFVGFEHLFNKPISGWPEGATWSESPALYDPEGKVVLLGSTVEKSGSVSDALHEVGHALGDLLLYNNDVRVLAAYTLLLPELDEFFLDDGQGGERGRLEFFAESVACAIIKSEWLARFSGEAYFSFLVECVLKGRAAQVEP